MPPLGPNKFRVDYESMLRSKCKGLRCKRAFNDGELRVGKIPPRARNDNTAPARRVHWYHPACIFKSFERAAKTTKTIRAIAPRARPGRPSTRPPPAPPVAPTRRSGRAPAPKVKAGPSGPVLRCERGVPIQRSNLPKRKCVEGAQQKQNGKWTCPFMFPGREFDDLDEYRAAKKQRTARRSEYLDQARTAPKG